MSTIPPLLIPVPQMNTALSHAVPQVPHYLLPAIKKGTVVSVFRTGMKYSPVSFRYRVLSNSRTVGTAASDSRPVLIP